MTEPPLRPTAPTSHDSPDLGGLAPQPHDRPDGVGNQGAQGATPGAVQDPGEPQPLWLRHVILFLGGQIVSLLGSSLVQYAVIWHITLTTKSGTMMALSALFGFGPQALSSIFGGVWADRFNRKYLIMLADGSIALTTLALALAFTSGHQSIWLLFGAMAIRSLGAGIQTPAVGALLPQLAPTQHLIRINGINGAAQSAMSILAPAAAAWLLASFELQTIFYVDVVTAAIGISMLALVPVRRLVSDAAARGYFQDLRAGFRYIKRHPVVRLVVGYYALVMFLMVPASYLTPLLIARSFGDQVWRLTANELAFSIGMMAGGAIIAAWGGLKNRMLMVAATTVSFGFLSIAMGTVPWFWVFIALMGLCGLAVAGFSTPSWTLLQETTDPAMQGRVFALLSIVIALTMPAGTIIVGPIADRVSVELILVLTGVLTVGCGLAMVRSAARVGAAAAAERARLHPDA